MHVVESLEAVLLGGAMSRALLIAALCLLSGCTQAKVPSEIYLKVDVYHHPGVYPPYRDGLPEGAHIVLPAVRPEGGSK
jgi:hypothetical protein